MASILCAFCINAWTSNALYEDLMCALTLHRIDAARNMARFYRLDIQPNLFGGVSLMKEWGRIGSRGRITYPSIMSPRPLPPPLCNDKPIARDGGGI